MRSLVGYAATEPPPSMRVVIVGGGAAGVITATHLLRAADQDRPVDVRIIEERATPGPGLAYRTPHIRHTLNNFAGRLSAVDGDPDHLLRWCAERQLPAGPTTFLQRERYGAYLIDVLDDVEVPPGSMLRRTRGVVTDMWEDGRNLVVRMSDGWELVADKVVLSLGNPPPNPRPELEYLGTRYLADPWTEDISTLSDAREVLLLGTGLTMVDVVAQLRDVSPGTRFTAASRRALLPHVHKRGTQRIHDVFHPGTASLNTLLVRVRERIQEVEDVGGDWRDVVDSLRACANDLWQGFSCDEQDWFVANVARHWEVARHRMPPEMATFIKDLQEAGTLRIARVDDVDVDWFDRVVNCTGPAPVPTRGWNPLVDSLLDRGTIRAHRLGLGLDLDANGNVVGAGGRVHDGIFAVGAARRGLEWEVTAVPDLRTQAAWLAGHLAGAQASTTRSA